MGCGLQMGKRIIWFKILISSLVIIVCTISLSLYFYYVNNNINDYNINSNCRLLVNNCIVNANNNDFTELEKYNYSIYDLEGNVISSNMDNDNNSAFNLKSLSGLSKYNDDKLVYTAPYVKDNKQVGTIRIELPYSLVKETNWLIYIPVIICAIVIIGCCYFIIKTVRKDVLNPTYEIHKSTNDIINGNLDTVVKYDYDDEIGTLCHDFELLRSNLSYSLNNEKKLKEKEKLLLAYISHDLRTPIATIAGYVEGINSGLVTDKTKIKEYTDIVLKKTNMLNGLIDDILEHSKAQLNEFSIDKEECYSKEFFTNILLVAKKDAESKNLKFSYGEIPNVLINIDRKRINQVMQNLIGNAIKFNKIDGEINVFFEIVDSNLLVSVKDTGAGIKASDLPVIFHEFYRGEKARTLNVSGSGLGLSISKYIVEKHGGRIECDSVLDYGSTFTFSLPI